MNVIIVLVLKSVYFKWEEFSVLQLIVLLGLFLNLVKKELNALSASLSSVVDLKMLIIPKVVQLLRFNRHSKDKTLIALIKMLSVPVGLLLVKDLSGRYQKLVQIVMPLLRRLKDVTT